MVCVRNQEGVLDPSFQGCLCRAESCHCEDDGVFEVSFWVLLLISSSLEEGPDPGSQLSNSKMMMMKVDFLVVRPL